MEVLSIIKDNKTVLDYCFEAVHMEIKSYQQDKNLLNKILNEIQIFLEYQRQNSVKVKHIQGSIFEFRISIPNSDYLLRIFFHWEKDSVILLTGNLVKPKSYTDHHSQKQIEKEYEQCITTVQQIVHDFKTTKKFTYSSIYYLFSNLL